MGQCPTWWSPCRTYVAPCVQRRKVWLTPTTRCRAVTLPRHETRWNLQGCLKLPDRSQPAAASGPKFTILWAHVEDILLLNKFFFRLLIRALVAKIQHNKVRWCTDGDFLRPVFPASRVQHISDKYSKFALRPYHVSKYGRHPICSKHTQTFPFQVHGPVRNNSGRKASKTQKETRGNQRLFTANK